MLRWLIPATVVCMFWLWADTGFSQEITFGRPGVESSVSVSASNASRWRNENFEVMHLTGLVEIAQQGFLATGSEAIVWVEVPDPFANDSSGTEPYKIIVYLEDRENFVTIDIARDGPANPSTGAATDRIVDQQWLGRLFTRSTVDVDVPLSDGTNSVRPAIWTRAQQALAQGARATVRQTQFAAQAATGSQVLVSPQTGQIQTIPAQTGAPAYGQPVGSYPQVQNGVPAFQTQFQDPGEAPPEFTGNPQSVLDNPPANQGLPVPVQGAVPDAAFQNAAPSAGAPPMRSGVPPMDVRFSARDSAVDLNGTFQTNPANPDERVFIGTGGIRVIVTSPELRQMEVFRGDQANELVILADNVVAWQSNLPDGSTRTEVYLDGNVIFAKDQRVIYADKMYYDVNFQSGTILDAEILTPVQQYEGLVRMKADVIQQVDENNLQAYGTAFTTSRLGVPSYWLQSQNLNLTRQQVQSFDERSGLPLADRATGLPVMEDEYFLESNQNQVYANTIPVFAWPNFRVNLSDPEFYLTRLKIGNDNIFGTQVLTGWNMFQLLGVRNPPRNVKWTGILDYLSERGLAVGSESEYRFDSFLGLPGRVNGSFKSWFINDDGLDFLGRGRFNVPPEEDNRGRIQLRHRHRFAPGYSLRAEIGYITDRNFLEQFYEREWDTYKDQTTGLWLERNVGTQSFNLTTDVQVNDFFTQTSWLPRFDHFVIGQPLAADRLVYHAHSHIGYGRIRTADPPLHPPSAATFDPLAWEADVDGLRAGTRHEIDMPLQIGPVKFVPYVLGDATYWGEALDGNDLFRAYGQTGVRASLPMWRVDPTIQSTLWNLNGLAHKVTFDMEASFADASQNLDELPLYDQLDDDSQEDFRRRFAFETFGILPGGDTPLEYDERFFALRSGMQNYVTAPSAEIADDLATIKFGVRQRWQTKRGLPGQERIIDWISLDAETVLFPREDRDNFGAPWGLFDYDFRWHVGDRVALVSDGYFDFFGQGLRTFSAGIHSGRPEVGNVYLGYRMIEGPISSNVITAAVTYRMSEKWGFKGTSQFDFGDTGTIGQGLSFIYIGESFLWQFGINADLARDNVGFRIGFEPRFVGRSRIFLPGGVPVGPAGAKFLE